MLSIERQKIIMQLIGANGQVSVKDLSERLKVSPATVRNDLTKLERDCKILKTHGGATVLETEPDRLVYRQSPSFYRFETRRTQNNEEKKRIVNTAVNYIKEGQCILLDASSTALELAQLLGRFSRLTVVTNGINSMRCV